MKIVIGGAGSVGSHLAKLLSTENHDIILIDDDDAKLREFQKYDLSTISGSPTSPRVLREAGVEDADLFIAVTNYESRNINSAIIAHKLGAKQTIARIDNEEYLNEENKSFLDGLGVNQLVIPEYLAAKEVVTSLENSWVRQWIEFNDGALIVVGVKVREGAPIVGQKLMELKGSEHYRLVAIRRDENTIIPSGQTMVKEGDVVYFITTKEFIPQVREGAGKVVIDVKDMMIMGAGRISIRVAQELEKRGIGIKVYDKDEEKARRFLSKTNNTMVIPGDATKIEQLKDERLEDIDAFLALTDNSEANILACLTARRHGVQKIIAEVENTEYMPVAEKMDIGLVINKMEIAASYIYRLTLGSEVSKVKKLTYAQAEIVELNVGKGSSITHRYVRDLHLPQNMFIGGLIREGKGQVVTGMTIIRPGDKVIIFCLQSSIQQLSKLFG